MTVIIRRHCFEVNRRTLHAMFQGMESRPEEKDDGPFRAPAASSLKAMQQRDSLEYTRIRSRRMSSNALLKSIEKAETLSDPRIFTQDADFYFYRFQDIGIFDVIPQQKRS